MSKLYSRDGVYLASNSLLTEDAVLDMDSDSPDVNSFTGTFMAADPPVIGHYVNGFLQMGFTASGKMLTPAGGPVIYAKGDAVYYASGSGEHRRIDRSPQCAFCGNIRISDARGGCAACGAPIGVE